MRSCSDQHCTGQKWFGWECVCVHVVCCMHLRINFKKINSAWKTLKAWARGEWLQCVAIPSFRIFCVVQCVHGYVCLKTLRYRQSISNALLNTDDK